MLSDDTDKRLCDFVSLRLFYNTNFSTSYIYSRFFAISFNTLQGVEGIVIAHGILTDIVDTSRLRLKIFGIVGQVIAYVWRLVISAVLPCHSHAVGVVVHKCRYGMFSRNVCREDIQCASVC